MKTDIDIKDDIYALIKGSALESAVTGELRKTLRPLNSTKEDIVIAVVASRNGLIQEAIVNVNIYVKDVSRGGQDEENSARLRTLADTAKTLFESYHNETFWVTLSEQRIYEAKGEHVINNRLNYKQCNN